GLSRSRCFRDPVGWLSDKRKPFRAARSMMGFAPLNPSYETGSREGGACHQGATRRQAGTAFRDYTTSSFLWASGCMSTVSNRARKTKRASRAAASSSPLSGGGNFCLTLAIKSSGMWAVDGKLHMFALAFLEAYRKGVASAKGPLNWQGTFSEMQA